MPDFGRDILTDFGAYQSAVLLAISLSVCLVVTCATYALARTLRTREDIRRRALTPPAAETGDPVNDRRSLRHQKVAGASRLLAAVAENFVPVNEKSVSAVRDNLGQAGFFNPAAVQMYYLIRVVLAVALPAGVFIADRVWHFDVTATRLMTIMLGASVAGLMAPSLYVSRRGGKLRQQCRDGFPDFMDLMVVCAEAGISIEAAVDRVSRELAPTYPYLGVCLHMASLELRAGRTLTEAFGNLARRLGIEEAHNLGSLLQQSEELGTSLTEALRVYSDEMRDKRMSRAEEKAHALPAKMAVPLTMFVFPVILIVILLPVFVRISVHM